MHLLAIPRSHPANRKPFLYPKPQERASGDVGQRLLEPVEAPSRVVPQIHQLAPASLHLGNQEHSLYFVSLQETHCYFCSVTTVVAMATVVLVTGAPRVLFFDLIFFILGFFYESEDG